jgi:hypothetical protein
MYFVPGDSERLDRVLHSQTGLSHPDERFLLDAPWPAWTAHRSHTPANNVNSVFSGSAILGGRRAVVFFKPLGGVNQTNASAFGQDSLVDVGLHEIVAWRLARELGPPWSAMVAPAVWLASDPRGDIYYEGSLSLGVGADAGLRPPGAGFDQSISDGAFFDAVIGHQDRHDLNLRCDAAPPRLFLIDHGYSFARPGDIHNPYRTAGFFGRMRCLGERRFDLRPAALLDYSAIGPLSPALQPHEIGALQRLQRDSSALLGVAELLPDDRAAALRSRVDRMLRDGDVLGPGEY